MCFPHIIKVENGLSPDQKSRLPDIRRSVRYGRETDCEIIFPDLGDFGSTIQAVMADGTEISMMPQWCEESFVRNLPDIPMVIDQIDHLIFEDGTVIQAE